MLATMKAATENIEPLPANGEESKEQAQETKVTRPSRAAKRRVTFFHLFYISYF